MKNFLPKNVRNKLKNEFNFFLFFVIGKIMDQATLLKTQKEKEDILMLKESFKQLGKLEEECNQELSNFQRENFIAHEEFRAVAAAMYESIDQFSKQINQELDKLQLKINRLETIAMHAFNIHSEKVISYPGAVFIACSQNNIYAANFDGTIKCYSQESCIELSTISKSQYDSIEAYGKITYFTYTSHLFVGFYSGMVLCFSDDLSKYVQLDYTTVAITCIHQFQDIVAVGATNGLVVLWNAQTLERVMIYAGHKLAIASIIDDGVHLIIAGRTGIITKHDKLLQKELSKMQIGHSLLQLLPFKEDSFVSISDQLLVWEGKHVLKTFNAIEVGQQPLTCLKPPELLLLGNKSSTELKLIFLESLLFPKTFNVLDQPPLDLVHFGSVFYVLTKSGSIFVIKPGQ